MIKLYFLIFVIWIVLLLNFWFVGYMLVGLFRKTKAAPYISSFDKEINLMKEHLKLTKGKNLVDLGCGDWKAMRFFVKEFGLKCEGYDINIFAVILGKILNKIYSYDKTIKLIKSDFLKVELGKYDYIYAYLLPIQLASIEDWVWKNMKKDALIITNSFKFAKHEPVEIIKNKKGKASIFLYRK